MSVVMEKTRTPSGEPRGAYRAASMTLAMRVAVGQMLAEAAYHRLKCILDQYGIDHLLLKGPHLGAVAYDEPGERGYCDLDVLVRPDQHAVALSALVENGFELIPGRVGRDATMAVYYNRSLSSPDGWLVELHRAFAAYELFRIDYDALFDRAVSFRFGETMARGLAMEDLLIHLVIHAAKSQFRSIEPKHVHDVALLAGRQSIDWEIFVTRVEEAGCRTASWVLLSAAVSIHGAAIPAHVLARLRPSAPRRWWLACWLTLERYPLFRRKSLPLWLGRVLVYPATVDGVSSGVASGLRFAVLRIRDFAGRPLAVGK